MSNEFDYKVFKIELCNIGSLKAWKLNLEGHSVVIAGAPNTGKTNILEALAYTLAGDKCPHFNTKNAVTWGESRGEVNITIRNKNGDAYYVLQDIKDGEPTLKIQPISDQTPPLSVSRFRKLISGLGVNVGDFKNAKPDEQVKKALVALGKIDEADELEERRRAKFEERTETNREAKRLSAVLDKWIGVEFDGVPDEPLDATAIIAQIKVLQDKLANINKINQAINDKHEVAKSKARKLFYEDEAKRLTAEIEDIDKERRELLADTQLPISHLTFEEDSLCVDGIPLYKQGESMQWEIAFIISAMSFQNETDEPKLRLLCIDGGESLGESGLRQVLKLSKEMDVPVIITYVDESGAIDGAVYIKAGG